MTPSGTSGQDGRWLALHQERDELRGRLGITVYDENPSWDSHYQRNLSAEEERAYGRLRQVEAEVGTMRAERDRQGALAREADEARRHTQTAYTPPLPRVIEGYLSDARPCPTCGTAPGQLRWTHNVQTHSGFGGDFATSWWATACLGCGADVEAIPECAG